MRKIIVILALALLMISIGSVSATDDFNTNNTTNISKSMVINQLDDSKNLNNSVNAQVTISGAVSDCITGKPFSGVTVKVKTLSGKEMAQTTTGQNGRYNVSFFSNETKFNVIAAYSGHLSPSQQVSPNFNASTGTKNAVANFRLGQPSVTIGSPGETFINEDFSLQVTFDNPSSTTGFGPIVQLSLPSQITFNSASYLGNSIKTYDLGIFTASGQIYNPLTRQMVNGTPGYRLIILEYPFGSFTPDQPAAPVTVSAKMAANATIGVPLNITATPVFRFGDDPVDNPSTDPPIYGPSVNGTVTPTVMRLTKRAIIHEDETATGPNYPVTYQLDLDIATGAVVSNVNITDLLSGNLQFLNIINAAGGTVINTPGATSPGGNITINFASITGVAGIDRTIQYRVYAPEFNSTNQTIINNVTGAFNFGPNDSLATGNYSNQTVTANGPSTNYNITLKSLAVQKSVTDLNGPNVKPTDILQYVIGFQVSDYFEFKNVVFTDIVGDGQSFLASFIPYLIINENGISNNLTFNSSNYIVTHNSTTGTWTILFNVSQQLIDSGLDGVLTGGLYNNRTVNRGATTGTIVFRTVIDIFYEDPVNFPSGDAFLTSNDPTTNTVTGSGVLTNSNNTVTDGSGTSVMVVAPIIEKKLYAINGNTTNLTNLIKPGDKLTFSLRVVVPTTNLENFAIKDFLPIPFLNATQVMVNVAQGDIPPGVGEWRLASDDTLSSFLGRLPTLNTSALDNTLTFNYGLVNSTDQNSRVAHILFTVNATNNPMADELYLTNLMNIMYDNSPGAMFTDNTIISFITQQPVLNITKGILNTTGSGNITPSPTILPVNGNLTGADAGDKLTFVITIGNQGHWNAYNTIIKDNVMAGFVNFNLISVRFGNGTPIAYSGNLTNGTGLILNQIIPANATVLITYTVDIPSNVYPRQIINNTAQITNYSSTNGGPNYVQDQSLFQDQARVTIADPSISKNLVNSTDPGTSGNNLTIGEQGTFRITVTLPEGQIQNLNITDILPSGLGYVGNTINIAGFNGTLAGFNGTPGNLTITTSGNNITFLFQGISTILGDNDNTNNTFYINILTTVLNNVTSNTVTNLALPKTNNASINWDNNPGSPITTSYNFNVVQPQLNISKNISPNPAVGGQLATIRFNVTNTGLSPAYNITLTDPLNGTAFNWATVVANSTPSGFTYNYNPATGIVTYTGGTLLAGQNAVFTFNVTLMNNIISNSSYNNTVTANYDSLNITTTPRTENRNYNVNNSTLLRTVVPTISKSINKTSENDSIGNDVFIGEVVTYKINITIPTGVTKTVTIRDVLSNGLVYISGRSLISRSSTFVSADGFTFTSLNLTDYQSINETTINPALTFFLGNITNSNPSGANETISLLFDVVVRNNVSNTGNRSITNTGNLTYVNASNQNLSTTANSPAILVRLPNLSISKNASTTTPQGNESITFTIVVRNTNGAMAPVYDGVITDLLDANFLNVRNIVVTNSTPINFNQTFNSTTGNLTVIFDKLPVNQNLTITFVADLKQNITFNQTTTNRVNVTGTSLPGPNGSGGQTPGAPGTDTGERTGDSTMPAGAVNNINATALVNVTARSPTINKTSAGSKNVTRTIGATAPQTIVVTIPTGTTNRLRITDLVPVGLNVTGGLFTYTIGQNLSVQNSNPTATFNASTNTWEFNFGQVNATQFSNITIDYNVTVLNVISNQNGVNLTNNATVYYQNTTGEVNGGSSNTTNRVIEPNLQITKTASTNIKPGDVCTFTLNISHRASSTSDAYDLTILDNIPPGMTYLNIVSLPGSWTADATQLPGRIIFNGPALLMGQNATIVFTCTVNNNTALAGTNITNLANLTYSSLSGTNPNERNYNTTGSSITHILGADIFVTKTAPATIYAGQQINFTITVGNKGPDTAVNVVLNDLIDPTWFARMNNTQYQLNGTWYTFNNPLTLNLGNISSLTNLTILVRGNINSSAPVGTLNNSVNVTTDTPDPIPGNNSAQTSTTVQQLADIVIDKTGPATVIAGNNISYSILVTNNGPSDAQNVHVDDSIPVQLINAIYSVNGGSNWLSWTVGGIDLGTIVSGSSRTILINATVPSSVLNGTLLTNVANATTTTPDPTPANDTVNTTVTTQADIYVTKSAPANAVSGSDIITYTINVGNKGPSVARNVVLTDLISGFIINPTYSMDNGTNWNTWNGTLNMGNLTSGSLMEILIRGLLSSNATGTINNTAVVNTTTNDPVLVNNTASVLTDVNTIADVFVTKSGPVSAVAGQDTITYTILVGNNGPSVARNVMVNDTIGFLSGVQYSLNGGLWNAWTGSLSLGNLSSGNVSTLLIRGLVPVSTLGTLNNTVNVNTTTTDPYLANNTANALTNITTVADVFVTKSAPVSVIAGQSLTYTLSVGNIGPSVARNVNVYDVLAAEILNSQYSLNNGSTWVNWTGSLVVGDMNPGSVINLLIRGNVSSAALGTINNIATVNSTTTDPHLINNTASTFTNVSTVADVYVTKSGPVSAVAGQDVINYILGVGNVGPSVARDVVLTDVVPGMVLNSQYSINGGLNWTNWNGTLNLGDLNPGDFLQVLIRGNLSENAMGTINNTAVVNSSTTDPYLINNTASAITNVNTLADIFVTKSGPVSAVAGQNITYNLNVGNKGPSVARNVVLTDLIPISILNPLYSLDNGTSWNAWNGTLNMGNLTSGSVFDILIRGLLSSDAIGVINNTAVVNTTTFDPILANNTASALTNVDTVADVFVTKSGPVSAVAGQDTIVYTLLIGNNGPSVARNVSVNDSIGFLSGVQYSLNGGSWNAWVGSLSVGNLTPGNVTTLLIRGLVPASALGTLNNTVSVNSTTTDPYLANNTASALTNVTTSADIYVTKSAPVSVIAGQSLIYTLSVGNVGPSVARNVNLYDVLAAEILNSQYSLNNGSTWVNWTGSLVMGDLNPGSVINLLIRGNTSAASLGTINNTATVNSTTTDPYLVNNTASTSTSVSTVADVFVTKSGTPVAVAGRDNVTYTLVVGNVGPSVARSVVLSDVISAMILNPFYSTNGGTSWNVWNGTLSVGDLNPGDSLQVLVRGNLSENAMGTVNNTAVVNTTTTDPYLLNNTANALTSVTTLADIFVTKSGPVSAVAGQDTIIYTILVGNNGPSVARDVLVDDPVGFLSGVEYSLNGGIWNAWSGSLPLGDLSSGNVSTLLIRGLVPASALGTLNNTVNVNSTTTDPFVDNNTASVLTNVSTVADVFVTKSGTPVAVAGRDNVTYTLSVGNVGPSVARDVFLTDVIPVMVLNPLFSVDGGVNWNVWNGTLSVGDLNPGSVWNVLISGNLSAAALGTLNNTAVVNSTTFDPFLDNNTASALTNVTTVADVFVTKSGTPVAVAGRDNVTYTLSVGNVGPSVARDVVLSDVISSFIISPLYSLDNGSSWNSWNGSLDVGDLNPGSAVDILIQGLLSSDAMGVINNTAVVNSTTFDPFLDNNTASALTNVFTVADVFVTKSGPDSAIAGQDTIIYTILVGNNGPSVARNVMVNDTIGFLSGVQYSLNGGAWNAWAGSILLGDLSSGNVSTLLIRGLVPASALGTLNNTVSVNSTTTDPFIDNNTASALTNVTTEADIFVIKKGPAMAIPGKDVITYVINVGNNGPSYARDVVLTDSIPSVILNPIYSINNGSSWNNWTGNLSLGDITPGSVLEILIRGSLSSSATQAFNNTAVVNSSTSDPFMENNTSTAEVMIKTADIAVIKAVNVSNPKYLTNVAFTIRATNNGPDGATGVQIKDLLPAGLKFVSYTTTQGTYNPTTGIWNIGSLNNGSYVTLRIVAQVIKSNTVIVNTATKYAENEYDPNPDNDKGNASINVAAAADLVIQKTVNTKSTYLTKKVYFTVTVHNYGPDTATGVYVKDVLPKGLKFASFSTNYGKYNAKTGIWTIGNLGSKKTAKLTIVSYAVRTGTIVNTATVYSKTYDPVVRPGDSKVSRATVVVKKIKRKHYHKTPVKTVGMQHTM